MKLRNVVLGLVSVALLLVAVQPAFAVSKEMVQLQTQVRDLQDRMARMQQSFDERMGVMRNLIEQSTDNMNKVSAQIDTLQKAVQQQVTESGGRVDQVSGQVQSLHDSVDEVKARLTTITKKLDDMSAQAQNLNASAVPAGATTTEAPVQQAPPPDVLYNNALRDYNAGKYDLATQEFSDYLKFYSDNDLAGNAQFYIADVAYRQGNFEAAVKDYDKVLELYPSGNKAPAAQLKKGFALLELGQRDAGIRELRSLVSRYPRAIEAQQARDRLLKLGVSAGARKPR